jgi:hypothetical protein
MRDHLHGPSFIKGKARLHRPAGDDVRLWAPLTPWTGNSILYDWASIAARLLADGNAAYRIGGMFVEFKNVADPDDPVTLPVVTRDQGIGYYNGLASSPDTDYLRIPLISAVRSNTDNTKFSDSNAINFFARTQGVAGAHGKTYSDGVNSKVYGIALVAIPDAGDRTQDIVFGRLYFSAANQQVKLSTSQIGCEYSVTLG